MRLKIVHDEHPLSPRSFDNLGTIVSRHRFYKLGDKQISEPLDEFRTGLPKNTIVLPLYLLDHGGITISTSSFSCPWDSGQVGFIYVTQEDICKEYAVKHFSFELRTKIEEILGSEIKVYDQYLRGAVWGYELWTLCSECRQEKDLEDSCWGFFGDTLEETNIAEQLPKEVQPLLEKAWEART